PFERARLLFELGRPAVAATIASAIVESQPEPSALLLLGQAERARGRLPPAIAALRRIPEGAAEYVLAQIELSRALVDSGEEARARRLLGDLMQAYGETWPEIAAALEALDRASGG
ncbi:MAG: tetratricopeptide repeat protein, partial [Polyangiaceae bacterium]|nr:tetratricopeptide repeat protein [Polyangiaceae bacterium]